MRKKEAMSDHSASDELAVASNGKSRKLRAGFATLAVLGMGAGVTLAAFSDNVPFIGNVGTDAPQLMAQVTDSTWHSTSGSWQKVGNGEGISIDDLTLKPGEKVERFLHVKDSLGYAIASSDVKTTLESELPEGVVVTVGGVKNWGPDSFAKYVQVPVTIEFPKDIGKGTPNIGLANESGWFTVNVGINAGS
jgi:hypothetical protein